MGLRKHLRIIRYLVLSLVMIISFQNCGYSGPSDPEKFMAGGSVVTSSADTSILYQQISSGLMPKGGTPLSTADMVAVYNWIQAGATSGSGSGRFSMIANLTSALSSYTDTSLSAATTYYYQVSVSNLTGSSPTSSIVSVTTPGYPPSAPTALAATATSPSQINLTWADNSSDENGFKVERATSSGGTYALIATLTSNTTSYSDAGLSASTAYYYRVYARVSQKLPGLAGVRSLK